MARCKNGEGITIKMYLRKNITKIRSMQKRLEVESVRIAKSRNAGSVSLNLLKNGTQKTNQKGMNTILNIVQELSRELKPLRSNILIAVKGVGRIVQHRGIMMIIPSHLMLSIFVSIAMLLCAGCIKTKLYGIREVDFFQVKKGTVIEGKEIKADGWFITNQLMIDINKAKIQ